jgi:hypothetical protein
MDLLLRIKSFINLESYTIDLELPFTEVTLHPFSLSQTHFDFFFFKLFIYLFCACEFITR